MHYIRKKIQRVGAIVGSLAEARFGVPEEMAAKARGYLPQEMLDILDQFDRVLS